ncbi:MAG: hypothetical protein JNK48_14945 [Bryobacterales bacterium]|nr:hypothetical protein [Bryobacterales bacterium]
MQWPKLRKSQETEARPEPKPKASSTAAKEAGRDARLKRLAKKLDELPAKDEERIRQIHEMELRQRLGAVELHELCVELVHTLNGLLKKLKLELTPEVYNPDRIEAEQGLLFQINATGRVLQIALFAPENCTTTEHFRIPYVLRGAVRSFNQESLERQEIQETPIFYCRERSDFGWVYMETRTRKTGAVDRDFLMDVLEELL